MKPRAHHHHYQIPLPPPTKHPPPPRPPRPPRPPSATSSSTKPSTSLLLLLCSSKRPQHVVACLLSCALFAALFFAVAAGGRRWNGGVAGGQRRVRYFKFPFCGCEREMADPTSEEESLPSACSDFATSRGPGQKVISYSLYGDSADEVVDKKYLSQVEERAREAAEKYPDWVVRVYYHNSEDDFEGLRRMCPMFCANENVDFCDVDNLPEPFGDLRGRQRIGRIWRFAAMLDPLVDVFVSRDLDSAILDREVSAVNAWMGSNRTFHVMRDHPSHNGYMMAGLWGAKNIKDRALLAQLGNEIMNEAPREYWDFDQALLRRIVWPFARRDSLQHDSYTCAAFSSSSVAPFPTRRAGMTYVGWGPVRGPPDRTGIKECPEKCRKRREWKFC